MIIQFVCTLNRSTKAIAVGRQIKTQNKKPDLWKIMFLVPTELKDSWTIKCRNKCAILWNNMLQHSGFCLMALYWQISLLNLDDFFFFFIYAGKIFSQWKFKKYLTGLGFPVMLRSALHFSENVPRWFPLCRWPNCCRHHLALIPQWASQGGVTQKEDKWQQASFCHHLCVYSVNTRANWKYGKLHQLPAGQNSCWAAADHSWC